MTEAEPVPETPAALQVAFVAVLRPGEKLLWAGEPDRRLNLGWSDFPGMFMGLFLILAAISAWSDIARTSAGTDTDLTGRVILPFVGLVLVMVGLYHLIGRIAWNTYRRRHSLYAVTTEHALIRCDGRRSRITKIPLAALEALILVERPHDSGTIILGRDRKVSRGWPKYTTIRAPRFELADNALWVYRLIEAVHHRTYWLPD